MLLKSLKLLLIVLPCFWLFSFKAEKHKINHRGVKADSSQQGLSAYGKYVYEREQCARCHTLDGAGSKKLLSLQGLQGKYTAAWHYAHLLDPLSMNVNSTMPSYAYLAEQTFTADSFARNIQTLNSTTWEALQAEAAGITAELKTFDYTVPKNAEILALIAFLQQIPGTNADEKAPISDAVKADDSWKNAETIIPAVIADKQSAAAGKQLYAIHCKTCHGKEAEGLVGPNLTDAYWILGGDDLSITKAIAEGVPDKGMLPWKNTLTPSEVGKLVAFIKSVQGSNPSHAKMKQGKKYNGTK